MKKHFVVDMDHLVSRLFHVLLAVEGGGDSALVCSRAVQWVKRKFGDIVLKIWSMFLVLTGVTQCNLYIEFVCGLRECPPGSLLRQNVSIGHAPG